MDIDDEHVHFKHQSMSAHRLRYKSTYTGYARAVQPHFPTKTLNTPIGTVYAVNVYIHVHIMHPGSAGELSMHCIIRLHVCTVLSTYACVEWETLVD